MRYAFLVGLLAVALAGCTSNDIHDTENRRAAAQVKLYQSPEEYPSNFNIIAEVKGKHCQMNGYKEPSEDRALQELRLSAAKMGAEGVVNIACQDTGAVFPCADSVTCAGDAI